MISPPWTQSLSTLLQSGVTCTCSAGASVAFSPLLYPLSHRVHLAVPLPSGTASGLPRSVYKPVRVRPHLFAGGATSAPGETTAPGPDHSPFWFKRLSTFRLSTFTTFISGSHMLAIPHHPSSRPPWCWRSQRLLALALPSVLDEATLSQELRTSPLPATHVLIGYR